MKVNRLSAVNEENYPDHPGCPSQGFYNPVWPGRKAHLQLDCDFNN